MVNNFFNNTPNVNIGFTLLGIQRKSIGLFLHNILGQVYLLIKKW